MNPTTDTTKKIIEDLISFSKNVSKPVQCLYCDSQVIHWNGKNIRKGTFYINGEKIFIPNICCKRVKCPKCGNSWQLRHYLLIPHKHYQLCLVSQVSSHYLFIKNVTLSSISRIYECSRKTVKRWIQWISQLFSPATLLSLIHTISDQTVIPRAPYCEALETKKGLSQTILKYSADNLSLIEVLGIHLNGEPPALRMVFKYIVGDYPYLGTYCNPRLPEDARRFW